MNPNKDRKMPATPKTKPKIQSKGPKTVKSVLVVIAYIVIAKTTANVKHAASRTMRGFTCNVAILTIQPQQKVNIPRKT